MALLHPDADLSLSLVVYGADILRTLHRASKAPTVDELMDRYLTNDRRRTPQSFFSALDMLFALGCVVVRGYRVLLVPQDAPVNSTRGRTRDLFDGLEGNDA